MYLILGCVVLCLIGVVMRLLTKEGYNDVLQTISLTIAISFGVVVVVMLLFLPFSRMEDLATVRIRIGTKDARRCTGPGCV